ncbi:MAG: shikimate kinase, partial [Acidimicrobiia bacterium]|nr:shikimate kinase [Acidimicrobiia bacterium]
VWLIGMMGSGKTTVGALLSDRTGRPFHDVDRTVQDRLGTSIQALWEREGEDAFRAVEAAVIAELAAGEDAIISTGGGAILRKSNREAMRRTGTVVWLEAEPAILAARLHGATDRPVLAGGGEARLAELITERLTAYEAAAHERVNTGERAPGEVAAELEHLL